MWASVLLSLWNYYLSLQRRINIHVDVLRYWVFIFLKRFRHHLNDSNAFLFNQYIQSTVTATAAQRLHWEKGDSVINNKYKCGLMLSTISCNNHLKWQKMPAYLCCPSFPQGWGCGRIFGIEFKSTNCQVTQRRQRKRLFSFHLRTVLIMNRIRMYATEPATDQCLKDQLAA